MKQDVTSLSRYFVILLLIIVSWIYFIYSGNVRTSLNDLFYVETNTL